MRFILISDTHIGGRFDELMFNKGMEIVDFLDTDYLIHCGDLTNDGTLAQYKIAELYLEKIRKNKPFIIIPGNHDVANVGDLLWEEMIGPRFFCQEDKKKKVKILALDSTEPDSNSGRMGAKGIRRIYEEFESIPEYWLKVLIFHHQTLPIPHTGRERSAIYDAGDAVRAILDTNIHIVFNGHRHISNTYRMSDGAMQAWIINTGTLSCKKTRYREEYSMTIVDVDREKNDICIRVIQLNQDPVLENIRYSGKFQEVIPPMKKDHLATLIQIGNTDISDNHFNVDIFNKGVKVINETECDLVIHCGEVTRSSYLHEFEWSKALLDQIEKPMLIVPGDGDAFPLGYELFPEYIGERNPSFENGNLLAKGFNSCLIDTKIGRLGRGKTNNIINSLTNTSKFGAVAFHHTIVPLPRTKHDSELMDAGDVLSALVKNRINLVLTGAKNQAGCWQVDDTVFTNAGTFSSLNITKKEGNSFNIINIFQTDIGKYYEIEEYLINSFRYKKIGSFHVSDFVTPLTVPPRISYQND
ncbi:MAG: metallophosphoesterase [Candidatus Heimdallarchaeota archaeon]|nr:metallophosphoesterase [Candidatus Heimdallarchaeota archaeon]MCK4954964.1 metallophosphoesterase [Candidatus Heimdallarchaeota archaeon]